MKKIYCLFILSLFGITARAQGYVITRNNDTIKCEVWKTTFGDGVKYKVGENGKSISVGVDNIKEYELTEDSSRYRAVAIKKGGHLKFLYVVEDGRICLYELKATTLNNTFNSSSISSSTTWYVSKNDSDFVLLKTITIGLFGASHDERKNELAEILSDEPKVAAEYKADDSFSFKKIQQYIHEYNLGASTGK